ncbi:MAG: alpha/beta fold hydrolase [Candidatus Nanoarchaeia archaeon]|nr:alpha/beta fold hydrolase [Candidatus Nanoarchaeia archaeon]
MKVYLVHGWGGSSKSEGWFDWLKKELSTNNIDFKFFDMPNTNYPKINEWVEFLQKNIKDIDNETYLIGHSIGCQTIMRYLEDLPENLRFRGVIFVAGWFNLINLETEKEKEIAKPWLETLLNHNRIKKHCNNFLSIFSDNDEWVPLSDSELFKDRLNSKIIIKHNEGHFNETKEIREIMYFIKQ